MEGEVGGGELPPDALGAIQAHMAAGGGTEAADPSGGDDRVAQLERLAELHQSGALTDEEFAAEKGRVLGSD